MTQKSTTGNGVSIEEAKQMLMETGAFDGIIITIGVVKNHFDVPDCVKDVTKPNPVDMKCVPTDAYYVLC